VAKPLVTFADPEAAVVNHLRAKLAGRAEPYAPTAASITTSYPSTTLTGNATAVQVDLESGGVADYPVAERAQVRVNCHAAPGRRTNVKDLASLTQGLLYGLSGPSVAGVAPLVGRSDVTEDPDTGNLMCWFLVRVDLTASVLAS
jgi:hypothetical protein